MEFRRRREWQRWPQVSDQSMESYHNELEIDFEYSIPITRYKVVAP